MGLANHPPARFGARIRPIRHVSARPICLTASVLEKVNHFQWEFHKSTNGTHFAMSRINIYIFEQKDPMKKNEPISKVMTTELTTVHDGQPVSVLRKIFESDSIHHIPVVSGENLVGIVTSTDFMRISFGEFGNQDGKGIDSILDHTYKMQDVMHKNPTTIPTSATVRDAARTLGSHSFHALPVVDGDKLVGLVTSTDLMNFLADL
ncbi:MAG: CBS domain-containing protein [Mariniblastus sp.]